MSLLWTFGSAAIHCQPHYNFLPGVSFSGTQGLSLSLAYLPGYTWLLPHLLALVFSFLSLKSLLTYAALPGEIGTWATVSCSPWCIYAGLNNPTKVQNTHPSLCNYCAFFKHSYYSFWKCLYFLNIGLLWVLGSWIWEGGQRLKNPLTGTLSFSYLSVQCPYWLHHGVAFKNNNYPYCSFYGCFLKSCGNYVILWL